MRSTTLAFTNLAQNPKVGDLIKGEIDKANLQLARVEQIKVFRILPKMLDPEEEGEPVTPTRKVKRAQMYERFKLLVEGMYDNREERLLAEEVGDAFRYEWRKRNRKNCKHREKYSCVHRFWRRRRR